MARRTPEAPDRDVADQLATLLRDRYLLWWRLAVRVVAAASLVALGRDDHGLGIAAAVACAAYDVALSGWLRRSGRMAFVPRLVLDSIDVAAWSLALGNPTDVAVLVASPFAGEAGARFGWRGLVVPLVVGTVTTVATLEAGSRPVPGPFIWPSVAVVLAVLAVRYLRLIVDRRLRSAADEIEAAANRAQLAGQNSVAAGADSVVDVLTRTTPLLAAGGAALPPSRLAAWKQALAETSGGQASYLGVALARWQRLRNSMSPDLTADVELRCLEGAGTLLLSPAQAEALSRILDGLPLCGLETVTVRTPAPAGREQILVVGGRQVTLPADPRPAPPSLDLGPVVLLLAAGSFLNQSLPQGDAVALPVSLALAAVGCPLAWWAHRRVQRQGAAGHAAILVVGLLLGAVDAVLATLTMGNATIDHLARFPFLLFLAWFGPLLLLYWQDVSDRLRWLLVGAAGAVVALGFALLHGGPPGHALLALVWPASINLACLGLRDMLGRDEAAAAAVLERQHQAAIDSAYRQGRRLVIDLVAQAAADAWSTYFELRHGLPSDAASEFERCLIEVDGRLAGLRAAEERAMSDGASLSRDGQGVEVKAMAGDVRHVTVHGTGRRVDLSLPATAPIAELMPALIRLCGVASLRGDEEGFATPAVWALARAGEAALALTSSLADAAVMEGEVLYLVDVSRWRAPAVVDLGETIERVGATEALRWTRRSTAWAIAGLALLTLAAAGAVAVRTGIVHDQTAVAALLLAFALLATGFGLRSRGDEASDRPALLVLVTGAWALAALGGWGLDGGTAPATRAAATALTLAAAMVATYPVAPAVVPGAMLVTVVVAAAAVVVAAGGGVQAVAVVVVVGGVMALRVLPRLVSLLFAALTSGPEVPAPATIAARAAWCRGLLRSLSAGTAAATLLAVLTLLAWGDALSTGLAAVVALSLVLRTRAYRFTSEILPLALAAGVVVVALEAVIGLRVIAAGGSPLLAVGVLVAGGLALSALSAVWSELPATPRPPAAAWLIVDLALLPLALGELGVFGVAAQLVRQLVR